MKNCINRFQPALVLFLVLVLTVFLVETDIEGGFLSAVDLFALFPAFVFTFFRALWLMIRDLYRVKVRGEPWPEETPSLFRRTVDGWKRYWSVRLNMSPEDRARLWLWRLIGVILFLSGLVCAWMDWVWPATLLMIAGVLCWVAVSPDMWSRTVNQGTDTVRTVRCPKDLTIEGLYQAFRMSDTMLGTPYIASVFPRRGDCLVYGPNEWDCYIYISKSRSGDRLYITLSHFKFLLGKPKTARYREAPPSGGWYAVQSAGLPDSLRRQLEAYVKNSAVRETGDFRNVPD